MDNGCLELRGVRIPRFHMCSRFARVERQGPTEAVYVKVPDVAPKIAYLTMMQASTMIEVMFCLPHTYTIIGHPSCRPTLNPPPPKKNYPIGARVDRGGGLPGSLQGRHHRHALRRRPSTGLRRFGCVGLSGCVGGFGLMYAVVGCFLGVLAGRRW